MIRLPILFLCYAAMLAIFPIVLIAAWSFAGIDMVRSALCGDCDS